MNPRYVVRPQRFKNSARMLATAFGVETREHLAERVTFDYLRDFFMGFPPRITNITRGFENVRRFFVNHDKHEQRALLADLDVPVPRTALTQREARLLNGTEFVVRPIVHTGGNGYRVTGRSNDFDPESEYIAEAFQKLREYRVVYVFGHPVLVIRKVVPRDLGPLDPWTWDNGVRFRQCDEPTRLHGTDFFRRMELNPIIQHADILGVDVLWNEGQYVVCEFNSYPSLVSVDNTYAEQVAEHVRSNNKRL